MKRRPLLLDLFCGAGGAAVGYHRAGFDVVGVDIDPQPAFPFHFVQCDVTKLRSTDSLFALADAVHASPPCQSFSRPIRGTWQAAGYDHPDLVDATRRLLRRTGKPYVIENVPVAPLHEPIQLCGEMFALRVIRHRKFESNIALSAPEHVPHKGGVHGRLHGYNGGGYHQDGYYLTVGGHLGIGPNGSTLLGGATIVEDWGIAMGIDWMTRRCELAQAIPPAYTQHVGAQLKRAL